MPKRNPRRHRFTPEECKKGGEAGFRAAVASVQERYNLEFNDAVQWLKRRIGWMTPGKEGK